MAARQLPCPTVLRLFLEYCPDTGTFSWKRRARRFFKSYRDFKAWNARYPGERALYQVDDKGYAFGRVAGPMLKAHRVAWAISYGEWPSVIDHINGNPADNRLSNLRNVTTLENSRNAKIPKNNTSGVVGVSWNKASRKWCARIGVQMREIVLGYYASKDEAIAARRAAEKEHGFHENHGRQREVGI